MSSGEFHTTWWPASTGTSTFGPSYTTSTGYGYNPAAYAPPLKAEGWRCPSCQLVMAPWVPYHQCEDPPQPDVLNKADDEYDEGEL